MWLTIWRKFCNFVAQTNRTMELKEIFGARLKNARVIKGMSMDDLCTKMNNLVSKQTISKYESGKMLPNSTNLIALATALNVKPDYLLRPFTVSLDKIEFRKKSKMSVKEEKAIKEKIRDKIERYIEVEGIIGISSDFTNPIQENAIIDPSDVYRITEQLKAAWQLGQNGIPYIIDKPNDETTLKIIEGLFTTITNANFDNESLKTMIKNPEYDMNKIWQGNEDVRSLKSLILFGLKGMAAYAHHAWVLGYKDETVNNFFYEGLSALEKDLSTDELIALVLKTGEVNFKCMEMLDRANTETYGNPEPTKVTKNIEAKPFIVITGHDLHDLKMLLEQTKDKGINIYTHGEMLPALAYPELKKYEHLKGNFGTAWQNQQKEFDNIPAPILFTTNCIMPVKDSYKDRVFTTAAVHYPQCTYIKADNNGYKDFTPVINKALELGGYKEVQKMPGINGGESLTVGFGHHTVLSVADKVVEAVKSGALKHIFLVGGCDGAKPGRNYYTEFVKQTPKNTLVLTCACGKYRFNDLELGDINGIPRLLDLGQCNDAYSGIKIAVELAKVFNCGVNDLPLSIVLSWYEQKAVCVLLTLLYLGIQNIKLGPSLPAFVSPNVLNVLVDKFKIAPTTTPEADLKEILTK